MKNNKNNNCNFPTLRFPEFSEEWKEDSIGSVISIKSDKHNPELCSTEFICVELESISQGTGELLETFNSAVQKSIKNKFSSGSVLFGKLRPYLKKYYLPNFDGVCSPEIWVMTSRKLESIFLYSFIQTPYFIGLANQSSGSKMPRADWGLIANSKITYPSNSNERVKIGQFLKLIDERIATQNKIIAHLESLIKGLNEYMHSKYGNDILISLGDIGQTYSGLSGKSAEDFGNGKPYITYLNVYQNDIIDDSAVGYVSIQDGEVQNKVSYGDILFTLSSETANEVGITSVYLSQKKDNYLNSFCFGYRLNDFKILLPEYLPYCFSSIKFRKHILPFAQGSTRYNLQKADFIKSQFHAPTMANQKLIANIMYAYNTKLNIERTLLTKYKEQKYYLLQKLFI